MTDWKHRWFRWVTTGKEIFSRCVCELCSTCLKKKFWSTGVKPNSVCVCTSKVLANFYCFDSVCLYSFFIGINHELVVHRLSLEVCIYLHLSRSR